MRQVQYAGGGEPQLDAGQWPARLALRLERRRAATRLTYTAHHGPLYVQRPFYPEGPDCAHVYLLHPPGGIVSGDALEIDIELGGTAAALFTTPGAARVYRARPTRPAQRQSTRLRAAAGASLEWFPQETIVYDGADVTLDMHIELAAGARCIAWEINCLGLPASAAPLTRGSFRQRYRVDCAGRPVFIDGFALTEQNRDAMAGAAGLQGRPVVGFFLVGPFAEVTAGTVADSAACGSIEADILQSLRAAPPLTAQPGCGSITRLGDFYLGRYLGGSAEQARALFHAWWALLRPLLCGRPACAPRIWLT